MLFHMIITSNVSLITIKIEKITEFLITKIRCKTKCSGYFSTLSKKYRNIFGKSSKIVILIKIKKTLK